MKIKFFIIFIIFTFISYNVLEYEKQTKINNILNTKTNEFKILYDAIYNQYKEESNLIFLTLINKGKVLDLYKKLQNADQQEKNNLRKELFEFLKNDYKSLKVIYLRQLHFHLKNNESFLRMHRPNKYGDDLTNIRATVAYVNKYKKPVHGFEEGRIFNGFRFVFPIVSDQKHLGSVEISFSADIIVSKLLKDFNHHANLHINKKVIDEKVFKSEKSNYIPSSVDGYALDKEILKKMGFDVESFKKLIKPSKKTIKYIKKNIAKSKRVSIFDKNLKSVITILPIKNPLTKQNVAFISARSDANSIMDINRDFTMIFLLVILLIIISLYFIYKQILFREQVNKKLKEQRKIILRDEKEKKEKDKLLAQQTKMASMGDMLENIAHQWRQPLSVISTAASGIKIQKAVNNLSDESLEDFTNKIIDSTTFLSNTIDDFRDFFKPDKEKNSFFINDSIEKSLQIVGSKFKNREIEVIKNLEKIQIQSFENELIQVFINILNNSRDALENLDIKDRYIFIDTFLVNEKLVITFKDNGGGIPQSLINRVFEPYFTTKHKSQGTGIGMFMSEEIITKHLDGVISVSNEKYTYDGKLFKGALFKIVLPLDLK